MLVLEPCPYCQGSGSPGQAGEVRLICEACGGLRLLFVDRNSVRDEEDARVA